jgi:ribosome-binding factor A
MTAAPAAPAGGISNMPKTNARHQRIEAQMQRSLATLLPRAVKDPRVGFVTVTAVTLAADVGSAKVYVLPFGGKHTSEEVLAGLRSAAGFLRGEIGRELGLRHAPRLEFEIDTNLEKATALSRLIDQAVAGDQAKGATAAPADSED